MGSRILLFKTFPEQNARSFSRSFVVSFRPFQKLSVTENCGGNYERNVKVSRSFSRGDSVRSILNAAEAQRAGAIVTPLAIRRLQVWIDC
jgi:hypothetical protein